MVVVALKTIVPKAPPLPPASDTIGPRIRNRSLRVTETRAAWKAGPEPCVSVTRVGVATGAALSLLMPSWTKAVTRAWMSASV